MRATGACAKARLQATLRSVTSVDAVQLTPSALDSWCPTWVMPGTLGQPLDVEVAVLGQLPHRLCRIREERWARCPAAAHAF